MTAPTLVASSQVHPGPTAATTVVDDPMDLGKHDDFSSDSGQESPPALIHGAPAIPQVAKSSSPDSVVSTTIEVPNPFAAAAAATNTAPGGHPSIPESVPAVNWSTASAVPPVPLQSKSAPIALKPSYPSSSANGQKQPIQIASNGIRVATTGVVGGGFPLSPTPSNGPPSPQASPQLSSSAPGSMSLLQQQGGPVSPGGADEGGGTGNRRQKRLERNRESARLSRRRRKQYLEVLEERVNQLSIDMDKGRREHVAKGLSTLQEKRMQTLTSGVSIGLLQTNLSRSSPELRIKSTFQKEQLVSLSLPLQMKFILWLTLQNDAFFRGGRAASERLSAARIGERMLQNGSDRVPPCQGMWPLFCNEVGLSYDQEEKVRAYQKQLLQDPASWVERHTANASSKLMDSSDQSYQTLNYAVGERDRGLMSKLNDDQKLKLMAWSADKKARIAQKLKEKRERVPKPAEKYEVADDQVTAAKLYILSHKMATAVKPLRKPVSLIREGSLKRLSRRPLFESLGTQQSAQEKSNREEGGSLATQRSFSSGSLKRSLSDMSCDPAEEGHGHHVSNINSEDAQKVAIPTVDRVLGFVKEIIPAPKPHPVAASNATFTMPPPVAKQQSTVRRAPKVTAAPVPIPQAQLLPSQHQQHHVIVTTRPAVGAPVASTVVLPQMIVSAPPPPAKHVLLAPAPAVQTHHVRIPSFLPPHLNIVPEEQYLPGQGEAEDFLLGLTEEDWAIGEGFEMDVS
uniref:BZIP domain-containing protein n=1 Tax=Grammatophora oceanica TaxID=210454 RepID=A0A7S1VIW2_9STRA|mmetsp:Transcript_47747/g.71050  ORF Transcript_47747/g.71050 Transcript_47747/m.71050 type:complete len:740 (+) Transcript_47747:103-2322(+)|eukprot:CAMPEP_0194068108 /NCGR_PEP_ID=MMETSP0009_2-20130614/86911_1 /TAXON_ID=210454 /ORGANISM="Grammatophora oceanica, Strain CCMP 410" /LENGTH=739 /DNA_ID=CAMNT_0038721173 /DNA_START=103 /DNA_END=2322 /DNA_ORIENTATION=+